MQTSRKAALGAVALAATLAAAPAALGAAPTATDVSDNFNRSTLGGNWATGSLPDAPGAPVIASSARVAFPSTGVSSAHWAPRQFGAGQQATLTKRSGGVAGVTACVRTPGASASGYALTGNGAGALTLKRYSNGSVTTLYSDHAAGGTFVSNDTLGIVVTGTGVEAWIKKSGSSAWQLARAVTDAAAASCTGAVGIVGQTPSADDFTGGAVAPTTTGPAPVPVQTGDDFVDRLGINVHFGWTSTPYCTAQAALIARLTELGLRHVRDSAESYSKAANPGNGCPSALTVLKSLHAQHGIRTQFTAHTMVGQFTTVAQGLAAVDTAGPANDVLDAAQELHAAGALTAVEGTNELDGKDKTITINAFDPTNWNSYVFPWRDKLRPFQDGFAQRTRARLPGVPVVFSSLAYGPGRRYDPTNSYKAYARLGDQTAAFDIGNMHPYSGIDHPEFDVADWFADARAISRDKPLQASEIGYYDTPRGDGRYISQQAAAQYLPRHILEMAARGAQRTFIYELADGRLDEVDKYSWGLVTRTGEPKPVFHAVRRLIAALRDPQTTGTAPTTASLQVSGPGVRSHVVGWRDGRLVVALWQPARVWDTASRTDVVPASVPASIAVGRRYDVETLPISSAPLTGPLGWTSAAQATTTAPVSVPVGGAPVLVRLTPR